MTSFVFTIIISLIVIFIIHRGFHHIKHYLTNEEKENIGVFHSKKYDYMLYPILLPPKKLHFQNHRRS